MGLTRDERQVLQAYRAKKAETKGNNYLFHVVLAAPPAKAKPDYATLRAIEAGGTCQFCGQPFAVEAQRERHESDSNGGQCRTWRSKWNLAQGTVKPKAK